MLLRTHNDERIWKNDKMHKWRLVLGPKGNTLGTKKKTVWGQKKQALGPKGAPRRLAGG